MHRVIEDLSNRDFDLLVVGGGIYGACILWDASLRGLSAALIERGDFGQATSANSLKIVHGGLRYLQDADISLVRMMNKERTAYLRIAPHLVHPLPCLIPTDSSFKRNRLSMGLALKINDLAGYDRNQYTDPEKHIPAGRLYSLDEYSSVSADLPHRDITGGALWYDGQIFDTERLTLSFVRSAAESGAAVANYVEATGFMIDGSQVVGVDALDVLSGEEFEIRAAVVVNAAGPWVDDNLKNLQPAGTGINFHQSLAVNLITRKLVEGCAVGVPTHSISNRSNGDSASNMQMLFISPWRGKSIIGTFHSHYQGHPDQFQISRQLLEDALRSINSALPQAELELGDISFVHHGFLPEKSEQFGQDVRLVRRSRLVDHRLQDGLGGLITVVGVKYTTARKTAQDAVDLIFDQLGHQPPASQTAFTQLHNGRIERFEIFLREMIGQDSASIDESAIDHLVRSYGTEYPHLRELIETDDGAPHATLNSHSILKAQVVFAVREEMALKLADVILRRTGLGTAGVPAQESIHFCAQVMADELAWDEAHKSREIDQIWSWYQDLALDG